jgi:putative acetyltransferase
MRCAARSDRRSVPAMDPNLSAGDAGWRVRPEEPADEPHIDALVHAAFGGPEVPVLLRAMRVDHCWRGLSFVATDADGGIVGHVCCTGGWVDAPERLVDVLVLSPLAVRPDVQRRGVGRELVRATLRVLDSRPEPVVFLEGDPGYYGRLGFEPAEDHGFERPSNRIPAAAFQCRRLPSYDEVVAGRLVYPDVFWRHDSVGLRP